VRRDVDLDVPLPELGHGVRIVDDRERLVVLHRRGSVLIDEVDLDLQARHGPFELEPRLTQHAGEHVEAPAHLGAVFHAVLARELVLRDVLAHDGLRRSTVHPTTVHHD
jgi:hypothetical protein